MVEVLIDGKRHEVSGRVATMIRWLIAKRDMIEIGHTTVKFLCRGKAVTPSVEVHHQTLDD